MFPLASDDLSFADISDFWSRYLKTARPDELLALLEKAWWRGEIRGVATTTRLQLIRSMFRSLRERSDLGIVFVREGDKPPPRVTELPDGSARVDLAHFIPVPSGDVDGWNEQTCEQAFEALAQTSSSHSYADLTPFFASIKLPFAEFDRWRKARGFPEPGFWSDPTASTVTPEAPARDDRVDPGQGLGEAPAKSARYPLGEIPTQSAAAYAYHILLQLWGPEGPPRSMSIHKITDDANERRKELPPNKDYPPGRGGLSETAVRRALGLSK